MDVKHAMRVLQVQEVRAYEVDDEAAVGGAAGRPAEVCHAERALLRREGGPEAAGVGVGVAEVEDGRELAAPGPRRRGSAAQRRRHEEQRPDGPHRAPTTNLHCVSMCRERWRHGTFIGGTVPAVELEICLLLRNKNYVWDCYLWAGAWLHGEGDDSRCRRRRRRDAMTKLQCCH